MTKVLAETKEEFFAELDDQLQHRLTGNQVDVVTEFTHAYFAGVSVRELQHQQWDDLHGSVLSCWRFFQRNDAEAGSIRVINPTYEEDGWQSGHTIIEVVAGDYPFLVDSIRMEIIHRDITVHCIHSAVLGVKREDGLVSLGDEFPNKEAVIHLEIDRQSGSKTRRELKDEIAGVLALVTMAVRDFGPMRGKLTHVKQALQVESVPVSSEELTEACDFLSWLDGDNFTYLGYTEFTLGPRSTRMKRTKSSGLGIVKSKALKFPQESVPHSNLINFCKSPIKSRIHRPVYLDVINVNRYNDSGEVDGIYRFIGLYTARVYTQSPSDIPIVERKVADILQRSELDSRNYQLTELRRLFEVLPREELFLCETDELFKTAMDILAIQERRMVRVFIRGDHEGNFVTCLMYMPKDIYTTQLRLEIQNFLCDQFDAIDVDFATSFSASILVRTYFELKVDPQHKVHVDQDSIEEKILQLTRSWDDDLKDALLEVDGEEYGNLLLQRFKGGFPSGYKDRFAAHIAVTDIHHMMDIDPSTSLAMSLYRAVDEDGGNLRFKLFHNDGPLPLSDVIPLLENMGTKVIEEYPYDIRCGNGKHIWIHDFRLEIPNSHSIEMHEVRDIFQQTFGHVWQGVAENDGFNRLVLGANLDCREVSVLRAYSRYMRQIRFGFSQVYIAEVLSRYAHIAQRILQLFLHRFDPDLVREEAERTCQRLKDEIISSLEEVENLSDDRIIRRYVELVFATLRTNYFQNDESGDCKHYTSFKFDPEQITALPMPVPKYEIFVYSTRTEGVHLRGGKVARGGLRWSDRSEDYRTEILGLVKAQQVKNSVIVPVGAKGGFFAKQLPVDATRDEINEEGIACYRMFIRGLLDLTDNLRDGDVIPPDRVIRYDDDDIYLVVAADKGTATFSDIANELSLSYEFWLGDAFASGGSAGYDHKEMGITAKGAWISVQQHFRDMRIDVQKTDFTVAGIGDMAGDVFGNGMLMSEHIRLVAAFNHLHIFIDPDPDPEISFQERKRIYGLARSSWSDYGKELISAGGGIFARTAKSIPISEQMQKLLEIEADALTPNQLITAILKGSVDLLWNGGIGTYVKGRHESHEDVGDKANEAVRIDGAELRCKVIGEGGNLGMTQLGRVEYCQAGGRCFTDFIDNVGGVNCSDIEVNTKILLNEVVRNGDMTIKQRNDMLVKMTGDVTDLVLRNNYHQAQAINLSVSQAVRRMDEYIRFVRSMEAEGQLDRSLEFLPDEEELSERKARGETFSAPEVSVLTCYAKGMLKEELVSSDIPDDEYLSGEIRSAFPAMLVKRFPKQLKQHRLRREIVTTQIVNGMINRMGMTFLLRLKNTTGADFSDIARAYICARDVYQMDHLWRQIESLDYEVDPELQKELMSILIRMIRKATRWFLSNRRKELSPRDEIPEFADGVTRVCDNLQGLLNGQTLQDWSADYQRYSGLGIPDQLATVVAAAQHLNSVLGIVDAARSGNRSVDQVADVNFSLGEKLELHWFRQQVMDLEVSNHWHARAREAFQDELDWQQRALTVRVMQMGDAQEGTARCIDEWVDRHSHAVELWLRVLADIRTTNTRDYAIFSVAIRELLQLAQGDVMYPVS
ncbi:MAG: NAD-glutamate dehydrogenase [Pseudomonadales bacterium]|jgi:glutamate dehydrogenase|nr:NAD-glutamate dehydrogenase [Pseudomonadales bacterium]MDP7144189.1 NAD-glutamate dehydrogenase [Pseudomonadales bacterium]MDP7357514.1 NAD-glutamate dehydrogenase [Pseudomonadales bacterium]MDP7595600.1 NAD-glutamate dehydrogenase [Pseudomonadales bacterium]HJN49130.1 NAD-glutamate dehydrogenase [Pseudomonadales bacterium]